jgi:hypothetical protein
MSPVLDPRVAALLPQLSLKEWAELLYHAAEFLHELDRDASCYAHRASACITQNLAERRRVGPLPPLRAL